MVASTLLTDSELFLEQATWFAPHLPSPTITGLACWIAPWLSGTSKRALESQFRLAHPAHIAAEQALVRLLKAISTKRAQHFRLTGRSDHTVDWPRSLARAHPYPPTDFVQLARVHELDEGVLNGLATVAREWAYMLIEYGGESVAIRERVRALDTAAVRFRWGPLHAAHLRRLVALGDEARVDVATLQHALELASLPLRSDAASEMLTSLARQLACAETAELDNANDALELSVILGIVRAAADAGFRVTGERGPDARSKPVVRLERDRLMCEVRKGLLGITPHERCRRDVLAALQRDEMGIPSQAGQPDIVLRFWRAGDPEHSLFCIADAKRNATGDGIGYLKASVGAMTNYVVAFSEELGAVLDPSRGGFCAPIMPAATLFMHQAAAKVAGANGENVNAVARRFESAAELPWLVALDRRHFAVRGDRGWESRVVRSWFERVAADAARGLGRGRATTRLASMQGS